MTPWTLVDRFFNFNHTHRHVRRTPLSTGRASVKPAWARSLCFCHQPLNRKFLIPSWLMKTMGIRPRRKKHLGRTLHQTLTLSKLYRHRKPFPWPSLLTWSQHTLTSAPNSQLAEGCSSFRIWKRIYPRDIRSCPHCSYYVFAYTKCTLLILIKSFDMVVVQKFNV